mmetsp:Transcript_7369/g.22515  ORF Transcript_7369/g.22515 Transcript_7369/m.22515 type:complete len:234 (+) Transcript_7369:82-783(+)
MACCSVEGSRCSWQQTDLLDVPVHTRRILTAEQAVEIFKLKEFISDGTKGASVPIARQYGVSPKTIRDIWNRRTWMDATVPFLSDEDAKLQEMSSKKMMGRPSGIRNTKPKVPKKNKQPMCVEISQYFSAYHQVQPASSYCQRNRSDATQDTVVNVQVIIESDAFALPDASRKRMAIADADEEEEQFLAQLGAVAEDNALEASSHHAAHLADDWCLEAPVCIEDPFHCDWAHW